LVRIRDDPSVRATRISARRVALEALIDHAALFPPASMSMADALLEDRRVRAADTGWIVNRFVVPASRLAEVGREPLPLSVVYDSDASLDDPRIEAVEIPPAQTAELDVPVGEIYLELAADGDVEQRITFLGELGLRAKVRCGGAAVPSVERLAHVIRTCRERGVPFKATAGLHHAIRAGEEHGFLNVLAAATFAGEEGAVLADGERSSFGLDDEALRWRDRTAAAGEIAGIRRELFVSFGSCSVQEPIDDLTALGILPP
jgi:hypothetical protein